MLPSVAMEPDRNIIRWPVGSASETHDQHLLAQHNALQQALLTLDGGISCSLELRSPIAQLLRHQLARMVRGGKTV